MKKKNENQVEEIKEEVKTEESPVTEEEVKAEEISVSEEETKVEEQPQKPADDKHIIYINKGEKSENEPSLEEGIEAQRGELFKTYRSTMTRNNILLFVVAAVFIAGFIMIPQGGVLAIIGWILIGITMVGMIAYYIYNRKLYPTKSKRYIRYFWQKTNDFLFDQPEFKDCYIDTTEVYKTIEISAERVYEGIIDSASRNLVHGKYHDKCFTFGELALYKAGAKKKTREVLFIGRHLNFVNDLHFEGRYVITMRNDEGIDLANDFSNLSELYNENNVIVYGPANEKFEKVLGKDLISNLREIAIKEPLLNINIVFWAGRTSVYLSYDDSVVAIPLEQKFNKASYDSLKENIEDIFKIMLGK